MSKVLIIPGAFQYVNYYGNYDGLDIWLKGNQAKDITNLNYDYVVAHSAGVNFAFTLPNLEKYNFIFINPLFKKRNFLNLIIRDIRYVLAQMSSMQAIKLVPVSNWFYDFRLAYRLNKIDVLKEAKKIPTEKIIIVRGSGDNFFCDKKTEEVIKKEGYKIIEADAGHDWNENIAMIVKSYVQN